MPYRIILKAKAEGDLKRLDNRARQRIVRKIRWLGQHVDKIHQEFLRGQWSGFYRYRVGDYRILYRLIHERELIIVEAIGHRRDVYNR